MLSPNFSVAHAELVEHREQQVRHVRVLRELRDGVRPSTGPDAPPASTIGSGLKLCWLPSLSELP